MADAAFSLRILAYADAVAQGAAVGKAPPHIVRAVLDLVDSARRQGWGWARFEVALRRRGVIQDPEPRRGR